MIIVTVLSLLATVAGVTLENTLHNLERGNEWLGN